MNSDQCIDSSSFDNNETNGNIISLFDIKKEEKAASFEEQEEDDCHRGFPQHSQSRSHSQLNRDQLQSQSHSQWQKIEHNTKYNDDDSNEENEIKELRKRLESLRRRRRRLHDLEQDCSKQKDLLLERLNTRRRDRKEITDEYTSIWKGRDSVCLFLDCAKRWNVLNDCFYIWIDGRNAFATINGCRLGGEAFPLPSELLVTARQQRVDENINQRSSRSKWVPAASTRKLNNGNDVDLSSQSSQLQQQQSPPRRRYLGFFSSERDDTTNVSATGLPSRKGPTTISKPQQPMRVPWLEVNAALGYACLLLKIIQEPSSKNGGIRMKFTHELQPMGATSKIGIRFSNSVTASANGVLAAATGFSSIMSNNNGDNTPYVQPVVYDFFFEEPSGFSFFKNNVRNFNWTLQAFLQCIAEATEQQKDKTIAIPHVIRHKKQSSENNNDGSNSSNTFTNKTNNSNGVNDLNGGEWTIGGLSICYPTQQQVAAAGNNYRGGDDNGMTTASSGVFEWTRACKYLLTDLKWLVAYAAKHS